MPESNATAVSGPWDDYKPAAVGPWTKYAKQKESGPWDDYAPQAEEGPWVEYAKKKPNVFDQFDPPRSTANVFDQFDAPKRYGSGKSLDLMADGTMVPTGSVAYLGNSVVPATSAVGQELLTGKPAPQFNAMDRLAAIPAGFNSGVAQLAGLPMTALTNASNLVSAGGGYLQSKITGGPPSSFFDPVDPSRVPLTGNFNERMLNGTPLGNVTGLADPNDPIARVLHSTAAGVPGGLVGGAPVKSITPSAAAGAASGVAGELGADPATQAALALVAGHGTGVMASRPAANRAAMNRANPVPKTAELANAADAAYKASEAAGVVIKPKSTQRVVDMMDRVAKSENLGKLPTKLNEARGVLADRIKNNEPLTLRDADKVRQLIGDAFKSTDAADRRLAKIVQGEYDRYLDNLKPADVLAGDSVRGVSALQEARDLFRRRRNSEMLDTMDRKATAKGQGKYTQAGTEHALRQEYLKLIMNDRKMRTMKPHERAALEKVAAPGRMANTLRNIGKYDPARGGMGAALGGGIGGSTGALIGGLAGGPVGLSIGGLTGAALVGGTANVANRLALRMTKGNVAAAREALVGRGLPNDLLSTPAGVQPQGLLAGTATAAQVRSAPAIRADLQQLAQRAVFELAGEPAGSPKLQAFSLELARLQRELAAAESRFARL